MLEPAVIKFVFESWCWSCGVGGGGVGWGLVLVLERTGLERKWEVVKNTEIQVKSKYSLKFFTSGKIKQLKLTHSLINPKYT